MATITKEALLGYKKIKINGWKFIIKKINPLADFTSENMPQIFTSFISKRKPTEPLLNEATLKKMEEDMKVVIEAGLVEPKLSPRNKSNEGITVDDLFRDYQTAADLYKEIFIHSLNRFRGIKGLFFCLRLRYTLFIHSQKNLGNYQQTLYSGTGN